MGLRLYRSKRNFSKTAEPSGAKRKPGVRRRRSARFVVQKHDASRLHYDFRLEMDGALKSWAVPKGVPMAAGEKRLAILVEDHPLEYGSFEGIIPEGNYGAGTVMLWDRGTYAVSGGEPEAGFEAGNLELELRGKKLKGQWSLVRLKQDRTGKENGWLLIKTGESAPSLSVRASDTSAKSGRSLRQIEKTGIRYRPRNHAREKT